MNKSVWKTIIVFLPLIILTGCVKLALQLSPSLVSNLTQAVFEECNPDIARTAIPANLKLLEGLLKSDPDNEQILTTLSMGFTGYSLLFLELDNPEGASELYLRAKDYGARALGDRGPALKNPKITASELQDLLAGITEENLEGLFWTTMSWSAWINLNLDKPAAFTQIGRSQACLKRVIELDGEYFHGLPYILMGVSHAARPRLFGGNVEQARAYFEKAMELNDQKFFLAQYYFARYYAVGVQDKQLFLKLIDDIVSGDPHELESVCLINTVMQDRAGRLKDMVDDYFY